MRAEKEDIERRCHETLRGFGLIGSGGVAIQNVSAKLWSTAATIAGHELNQVSKTSQIGAVVHHPALSFDQDEAGTTKNREMCRHGVMRHLVHTRDVTGIETFGMDFQEATKNRETGWLPQ